MRDGSTAFRFCGGRKVRTAQGILLPNGKGLAEKSAGNSKCNRKDTAKSRLAGMVRVKGWGKSPPVFRVTGINRQTSGAERPNIPALRAARPMPEGRLIELLGDAQPR